MGSNPDQPGGVTIVDLRPATDCSLVLQSEHPLFSQHPAWVISHYRQHCCIGQLTRRGSQYESFIGDISPGIKLGLIVEWIGALFRDACAIDGVLKPSRVDIRVFTDGQAVRIISVAL